MLESVYLVLIAAAFSFLAMAFWISKPVAKPIFSSFSVLLFAFLAFSSTGIQIKECTDTACTLTSHFFDNELTLWFGLMWLSAMLTFALIFLLIAAFIFKKQDHEII